MKPVLSILFLLVILAFPVTGRAAYLTNVPVTVRQADGTILKCFATGDEYHNWLHDENNFTIMQDPSTGDYVYATMKAGQLRPTSLRPGRDDPASAGLVPGANISAAQASANRTAILAATPAQQITSPTTGTINNLVVFIRFSDQAEFSESFTTYSTMFNSTAVGANSMYNYFNEVSYNSLEVLTSFYPVPSGTTILSYQDAQPRGYYCVYNATTNPIGYSNDTQRRVREHALLNNAVVAVRSQIPTALNIDADYDGFVDNICFVVSGSTEAWSSLLWPHAWSLYSTTTLINGKRVYDYNLQLSEFLSLRGNGVLCHEMLHTLGAPDLYNYSGSLNPVGSWDVMASTANPPQHPTAYLKYKYLNWIPSMPAVTTSGQYTLSPATSSSGNSYAIASPNSSAEYFVAEYRRKTGTFESSVPDQGMIVYRINPGRTGNASGPPDEVYVYRPNGTPSSNGTISKANFSSASGRTILSDSTNPSPFLTDGSEGGLYISGVGNAGSTITFDFRKPGIVASSADGLILGHWGTLNVIALSPKTADYMIEVKNRYGTGAPAWTWSATTSDPVQVSAGRHQGYALAVQPSTATEIFSITLLKREAGGTWESYATREVTLNAADAGEGTLVITTADAEGWPGPHNNATVRLSDSTDAELASARTDTSGIATFSSVFPASRYQYKVFFDGTEPFGEQYWGSKGDVTVVSGGTTDESFIRNAPYCTAISVLNDSTHSTLSSVDTVEPGTRLRVDVSIKNPDYAGALPANARALVIIDRDMAAPYDFEVTGDLQLYSTGASRTVAAVFTPALEGQYSFAVEILTDFSGSEKTTDAGPWRDLLTVAGPGTGTLSVTIADAEDWGNPGNSASVRLFAAGGTQVGVQTANAASTAVFAGIPTDSVYSYTVHYANDSSPSPFSDQYWGSKSGITISRGATLNDAFKRNAPYGMAINAFDSLTSAPISYDTSHLHTPVRITLLIKNPSSAGSQPAVTRGRIILDRDQNPPYDFDRMSEWHSLGIGETNETALVFTPEEAGDYFMIGGVITSIGNAPVVTDAGQWKSQPFLIIEGGDTTPPPPPMSLSASPDSWTNVNSFTLGWVDPFDQSGIAAAWYSVGKEPAAPNDGTRSTARPLTVVTTNQGEQPVYVWLEDSSGNVDNSTAATTMLFFDSLPPNSGRIVISAGADTTTSLLVTLSSLSARDTGGSSIAMMHFSNDGQSWSEWEPFAQMKTGWDLSLHGGSTVDGPRIVRVQYRDYAGNSSAAYADTIMYRSPDATAPTPPRSLAALPPGWTKASTFELDWTNPSDPSGIAAAWFKMGTPPTTETDGTRTTSKPLVVTASAEGGQTVYVWLEDGSGNKDHNNRSTTRLYYDATAPTEGTLVINAGAQKTSQLVVTLNSLGAHDGGGSGLRDMRFSNDDSSWASWEAVEASRPSWDLSAFGGDALAGMKSVFVQFRDSAGNMSASFTDDILYSTSSVEVIPGSVPTEFELLQNYPNPFNPATAVVFQVPNPARTTVRVYNVLGDAIATLIDEELSPGTYRTRWAARNAASGVYFVRMVAGSFVSVKRMLLVR